MAIAILEIQGPAESRSGVKDGRPWGPFFTQVGYVHGVENSSYPHRVEFGVGNEAEAHPPGLYLVDASAFYTDKNQKLAVGFRKRGHLVPIDRAAEQLKTFIASRQTAKAA